MNVQNYEEVVEALQPRLADYLQEKGILEEKGKNFHCLSPVHEDNNPSMGIAGSGKVVHCFGCGYTANIFQVCALLENKPSSGPQFIPENLKYLADKYQIKLVEGAPMTEEQVYEMDTYKAYRTAADLIVNGPISAVFSQAIAERGWTPEICREFGVGCISDYNTFRKQLRSLGFTAGFLDDVDLSRKDVFGEDRMVFTIRDEKGTPVGFSSRNLSYTDDKKNGTKYVNQRSTGVKCNIYRKSERLYGFDRVLKLDNKKQKKVYIFEGYADVITAAAHGLNNCVALGGTVLTADQVHLLKDYGYYHVVLCLDGDTAGQERVAKLLDTTLGGHKDLNVSVIVIPSGKDPDQFIREETITKFSKLKEWTAFEWRLSQFEDEADSQFVCDAMIPLIVNESSYVAKEKMCEVLAKTTGITLKTIQQELDRQQDAKSHEQARERQNVIDQLMITCQRDPTAAEDALQTAENALFDLSKKYEEDSFSEDSCLAKIRRFKEAEEAKDGSFTGFLLGPDLDYIESALCGDWRKDVWFVIGGKPNSGKTSLMCKMIFEIARHPENNACVIYHTVDDTTQQVLPKFVCVAEGSHHLLLNQVMDPNYHKNNIADEHIRDMLVEKRETGYTAIQQLISDGRLVIKDANDGITLAYADRLIRYYKNKYPDRNIVYVLDNFHKLESTGGKQEERVVFKNFSKGMKRLVTKWHILGISTVEYRKTLRASKAGNEDISETIQIEYDSNLIAHVHNELHEEKGKATHVHYDTIDGEQKRLPRIEFDISKNKVTAFKETIWLDFWPSSSDFKCVASEKVATDAISEKNKLKDGDVGKRAIYFEFVQETIDKGWKESAPNAKYHEEFGEWPPNDWQRDAKKMMEG